MTLRIRRADTAPGTGSAEYFSRTPESVSTDRDCSLNARGFYAVITLHMVIAKNPVICLDPLGELAQTAGISERQARRLVAELERRGHVARERVRTISGSPQGIRPLATLRKPRSTRTDLTDCNRTDLTGRPDTIGHAPGPNGPGDRTDPTAPSIKREKEKKQSLKIVPLASDDPRKREPPPPAPEPEDTPEELAAALAALRELVHPGRAQKCPVESSAKTTPPGESRDSVPDAKDSTKSPDSASTCKIEKEHKAHER
jgi:hypothetical protein